METVRAVAEARGISLGKAISALLREALERPVAFESPDGFPVMPRVPGASELTAAQVESLLSAADDETARFVMARA